MKTKVYVVFFEFESSFQNYFFGIFLALLVCLKSVK
jgi:hypothetical protein